MYVYMYTHTHTHTHTHLYIYIHVRARKYGFRNQANEENNSAAAQSLYRAPSELNPKLFAGKANTGIPP